MDVLSAAHIGYKMQKGTGTKNQELPKNLRPTFFQKNSFHNAVYSDCNVQALSMATVGEQQSFMLPFP